MRKKARLLGEEEPGAFLRLIVGPINRVSRQHGSCTLVRHGFHDIAGRFRPNARAVSPWGAIAVSM